MSLSDGATSSDPFPSTAAPHERGEFSPNCGSDGNMDAGGFVYVLGVFDSAGEEVLVDLSRLSMLCMPT